jgi:hypothetical protein
VQIVPAAQPLAVTPKTERALGRIRGLSSLVEVFCQAASGGDCGVAKACWLLCSWQYSLHTRAL